MISVRIIEIWRDAQGAGPSVCNGTVVELSKQEVEPMGGTVNLIFDRLDCLLVDAPAFGSVIIQDANVGTDASYGKCANCGGWCWRCNW